MYIPPAFREADISTMHQIIHAAGLANFVTATPEGPVCTPLPFYLEEDEGEQGVLYGHMARANDQWQQKMIGEGLALFSGPDAYISPSWYPNKRETGKDVPTWNYVAVHAYGPVEFFEERDRLLEVVSRLSDIHETGRPEPWAVSDAPIDYVNALLKGIVGLRMPIHRLEGKRKLSQNRNIADRLGVRSGLSESIEQGDHAIAALIHTD